MNIASGALKSLSFLILTVFFVMLFFRVDPLNIWFHDFIALGIVSGLFLSLFFLQRAARHSSLRAVTYFLNFSLAVVTLVSMALILEVLFSFVERSHSVGYSLAAQRWFRSNWHDNSSGYRDIEWSNPQFRRPHTLAVVGDSFVAGHGIKSVEDRFSNRLEKLMGSDWRVVNLGRNGVDTPAEFKNLTSYPAKIDYVVLSYFGNDIMETAVRLGFSAQNLIKPYVGLSEPVKDLIKRSYFADYLYWLMPKKDLADWWSIYEKLYSDPVIVAEHKKDLNAFVEWTLERNIPLVVVIFPYLHDIEKSKIYTDWVKEFFESKNIKTVEVSDLIRDLSLNDRIVNVNDVHPSIEVNKRLASRLHELFKTEIKGKLNSIN